MDNKQLKDGVGNLFTCRMRDVSVSGDGSLQRTLVFASPYPLDYGSGGIFQHCGKSGVIAAGLAANSPIYSFRWTATLLALIKRIRLNAWTTGTGFTAGIATFDLFAARSFTAQYAGGIAADLSAENNQMRTNMSASAAGISYANTAALTGGTLTLDAAPFDSRTVTAPTTANTPLSTPQPLTLFERLNGEHPLMLVTNEGFVIRATVPATGTWQFAITTEWDEVAIY